MTSSSQGGTADYEYLQVGGLSELELYRMVIESLPDVTIFVFDLDLRYALVAGAAVSRLPWSIDDFLGRRPSDILGPRDGAQLELHLRNALDGRSAQHEQAGIRDAEAVWSSDIGPLRDDSGQIVGAVVISRDVGDLRRAQEARQTMETVARLTERSMEFERWQREQLQFLVEVNDVLATCRTQTEVMRKATATAVPRLGDWCSLHIFLQPSDPAPAVELAHVEPAQVEHARGLLERFPYDPDGATGVPKVIRTGQPELYTNLSTEALIAQGVPPEQAAAAADMNLTSAVTVPVYKGDRMMGAMQFVISGTDRSYRPEDVTLAQAVAGRIAASLENRRLAERQIYIAKTLQRSLLPGALPDIPGTEVAVRYWAAGEGSEVGGDLYDIFAIDDDSYAVVIGDVCGNGPEAAATSALARHNIRASAWRGDTPAEVLGRLNQALGRTTPGTLCTVAFTRVTRAADRLRLDVALAGHPAPVVVRGSGQPEPVGRYGLVLGVADDARYTATTVELGPGDGIVFFTDGAFDLRPPWEWTTAELADLIASEVREAVDAESAIEAISARLDAHRPFSERDDDVALVVMLVPPDD